VCVCELAPVVCMLHKCSTLDMDTTIMDTTRGGHERDTY
jgi:hypothetical protein